MVFFTQSIYKKGKVLENNSTKSENILNKSPQDNIENSYDNNTIHVAARNLVETLYRSGSINQINYSSLSAREGTRTHQAFANKIKSEFRNYDINSEIKLETTYNFTSNISNENSTFAFQKKSFSIDALEISGRADLLLQPIHDKNNISFFNFEENPEEDFIIEVKTVNRPLSEIPYEGEKIHWLQSKIYTYMYWNAKIKAGHEIPASIPYALAYVSVESLECDFKFKYINWEDLKSWFIETCNKYMNMALSIKEREDRRDLSIENMEFPYTQVRSGQEDLMEEVYRNIQTITPLIAQAPTGTGKTISVLYPAIKQLINHKFEHIFYLTAKTSTRAAAENAIEDLRRNSGLFLRSITLMAKEQICPYHKESTDCPYSLNYYDNLPDALEDLWPIQDLNADIIKKVSEKHKVCAFELSLDASLHCDVIICDYNHVFNPRIQLERYFSKQAQSQIVLVDEAHNLIDRSRDMYSATLDKEYFNYVKTLLPNENMRLFSYNEYIINYLSKLDHAIIESKDGFDELELDSKYSDSPQNLRVVQAENFRATNSKLSNLNEALLAWVQHARNFLEDIIDPKAHRKLIEIIGEVKFFTRITDEFWSDAYIACARKFKNSIYLKLICLDTSTEISKTYINKHAAVFFSATLTPMEYFAFNFCGSERDNRPNTLSLYSPFPPENLEVFIADYVKTTYKDRKTSAAQVAKTLALSILLKGGQQFVYFPSFAYIDLVVPLLKKILKGRNILWVEQERNMSQSDRQKFLDKFAKPDSDKIVVGIVVLGGIFGEGIDLVGDTLTGVSIVSVGIPQVSPERNIMSEYYDYKFHNGFNFAYLYPAISKILQAAGRLIRSETDTGFILLIDERYNKPQYRQLLPENWEIETANNMSELKELLGQDSLS